MGSFSVVALFLCGSPACVDESAGAMIDERLEEPAAEMSLDARAVDALGPGERMVVDLTRSGKYSIDNELGDLDLQRIDVRTKDGEITPMSVWLGGGANFGRVVIDNESVAAGPTISSVSGSQSFNLPPNALRCFDVGWVPGGDSIDIHMSAHPKKARVLVRRRLTLASSWETKLHPASKYQTDVNTVYPKGYYQVCAEASSTVSTGISLNFSAPTSCGSD